MNILKYFSSALILLFLTLVLSACGDTFNNSREVDYSLVPDPFPLEEAEKVETETGLIYYIVEEGSGKYQVERRDAVEVFYTGRLQSTGEIFDSSYGNGNPTPTRFADLGRLIEGFKQGILGMKEGEKRVLIISPELGYGNTPSSRLSDDTLRFDVELDKIIL
jgi:FKBP-type peptidyl-prolyl cis-trans isomerase